MRALLILVILACAGAAHAGTDAQRNAFLTALSAARQGQLHRHAPEMAALKDYPLYPYLQAAILRHRLATHPDAALDRRIARFVAAHPKLPPAQALRGPWLASLARRARWRQVIRYTRSGDGATAQCRRVHAEIALGRSPTHDALALYDVGHSQPHSCNPVFAWLKAHGQLSASVVRERARKAILADNDGLARYLARHMPTDNTPALHRWLTLAAHPDRLPSAPPTLDPDIAVHLFERLALRDPDTAAAGLASIARNLHLDAAHRYRMRRYIALLFAEDHRPQALLWFARIDHARMADDPHALGWEIRAALFHRRWPLVLDAIRALPADLAKTEQWQYWKARALAATGHPARAHAIETRLAGHRSYHGYLAADVLGRRYHFNAQPAPDDPHALARVKARPALARARELHALGMIHDANREWRIATDGLDRNALIQAARLAYGWHWYAQAIITLARAHYWDDLAIRYPTPYQSIVEKAADRNGLDPAYVMAIMRTESLFQPEIRSAVGARGLMQLMPSTAAHLARQQGDHPPAASRLDEPALNIRLGARYLRDMLHNWSGNLVLATASYNAGPGKVAQWLPAQPLPADIWIANIPYTETRHYVERAMSHMTVFQHRLPESIVPLDRRLEPVAPSYPDAADTSF